MSIHTGPGKLLRLHGGSGQSETPQVAADGIMAMASQNRMFTGETQMRAQTIASAHRRLFFFRMHTDRRSGTHAHKHTRTRTYTNKHQHTNKKTHIPLANFPPDIFPIRCARAPGTHGGSDVSSYESSS